MTGFDGDKTHNEISGPFTGAAALAGFIGTVNFHGPYSGAAPAEPADPWVEFVRDSPLWQHVRPDRDPAATRDRLLDVAGRLAAVRDRCDAVLADDPWADRTLADRFGARLGWLLNEKLGPGALVLDPAEAALLVLVPLLHHALWQRAAVELSAVGPTDLTLSGVDGRRAYEKYLRGHFRLLDRAGLRELPDRSNARREIGWWLFDRWVWEHAEVVKPPSVGALLAEVRVADAGLGEVFDVERVRELLYALRLEPHKLCAPERLSRFRPHERILPGTAREERVRTPLLALLLGVAHAAAVPVVALTDTVVWHLGITSPVDLPRLHATLAKAGWDTEADNVVLNAACQHGAVIEALREHTERVDALLDGVRRAAERHGGLEVLGRLPARAFAEGVKAARGPDGTEEFSGWSRFTLDEQRVRELLMGEQLYQDRTLAVRELYQNALDACRYRSAREEYLRRRHHRHSPWEGLIRFTQGVDRDGRAFLDCEDNGVGMGEAELEGVFSRAGARFADLTEFRDELADWQALEPPIEFFPNSRFGIGVLSYFMLADEITVTTCRMKPDGGTPGQTLRATISGPGHLFQIHPVADRGGPGTTVRLYLRDGNTTSSVQVLRQLLGIAEFRTVAEDDGDRVEWEPGVLRPHRRRFGRRSGLDAHGALLPTAGGAVTWCEHGGAILVDGLVAEPEKRSGVLADPGREGAFRGAVVNLTGPRAPSLSVDRTKIVEDVAERVEDLLVQGIGELVAARSSLPNSDWLDDVLWHTPRLADLVAERADPRLRRFPLDPEVLWTGWTGSGPSGRQWHTSRNQFPDAVLLWRMLDNSPNTLLAEFTGLVPELVDAGPVLPPQPSDVMILKTDRSGSSWRSADEMTPADVLEVAQEIGKPPREVARRAVLLGLDGVEEDRFPQVVADVDIHLVQNSVNGLHESGRHSYRASPGQFVRGRFEHGLRPAETADRLTRYGFDVRVVDHLPDRMTPQDLSLFEWELSDEAVVPAAHVTWLTVELDRSRASVENRLADYGIEVEPAVAAHDAGDLAVLSRQFTGMPRWLDRAAVVPPGHVVAASIALGTPAGEVVQRLRKCGFDYPFEVPDRFTEQDALLLSRELDGAWPWLDPTRPVAWPHVVLASRYLRLPFEDVVAGLRGFGHEVEADIAPNGTDFDLTAVSLDLDARNPWLPIHRPVPLGHLIEVAARRSATLVETADWFRSRGYRSPHPAVTIREALRRVPLANRYA
ncbi:wHTH domain-containing protein [Actinosynnema sp. NPDC004786]